MKNRKSIFPRQSFSVAPRERLTHAELHILKFDKIYSMSNFISQDKKYSAAIFDQASVALAERIYSGK